MLRWPGESEEMRTWMNLSLAGALMLIGGCANLYQDNLDRAYQSGNLTAADYYRLRIQSDAARRQQMFQQQQILSHYAESINTAPSTPMFGTPFLPSRPPGSS